MNGGSVRVAAIQMDANPAPTPDRIARAEQLVTATAQAGAQLTVLPELFSTGYSYSRENHARVEPLDGQTAMWMRHIASKLGIHLAGSLMLLEKGEVYNALLLCAPDGRMWRYDKNYPWGWERGSFRASKMDAKVSVADTSLGNIGMLICWDAAHRSLWKRYAGRVDLMVICSCPPNVGASTYHFPNGDEVRFEDMGPAVAGTKKSAVRLFGDMINQQTAWLGVPAVNTVCCGHIRTEIPNGRLSLLGYVLTAPWLLKYLPQANGAQMSCDMVHECKVVDANGNALAKLEKDDREAFAFAELPLAEWKPYPRTRQPASLVPRRVYFLSDFWLPAIANSMYQQGRRLWKSL